MSDDLDKFVLQYQVDLKDSVARLEKLHEKMGRAGKAADKSKGQVKQFAADASGELGKLVPGLNAVSSAVKAMGAEFAIAGAAIGALAVGVKAVIDMRNQYNAQRLQGMGLGVSSLRMEDYQRKFVRESGGYVTRDATAEGLKTFGDMANSAYADPSRLGREARIMRMLDVNVGERGQTPTGLNDELQQLAKYLQGKTKGEVQGIAKSTGMNQDWLLTLQKLGPTIGHITELTNDEIQKRTNAEQALTKFNDQLAQLKEKFTEVANELAEPLLPALTKLVGLMKELADAIPKTANKTGSNVVGAAQALTGVDLKTGKWNKGLFSILSGDAFKPSDKPWYRQGLLGMITDLALPPEVVEKHAPPKKDSAEKAKKEQDARDAAVKKMDDINKEGIQTANQMSLAVNMFSGAVQSFSSAINLQQAWAAWAGEIGKANGLPGSSTNSKEGLGGGGSGNWRGNQYADLIKKAADKTGVDPQMLHSIMMVESKGVNGLYSPTGAGGLMQVTKGNWKKLGNGADVMSPEANIMVGAQIYADFLKRNKGDTVAALKGYNGNSDPDYVSKVAKYYGGSANGLGESKAKMNIRSVQQQIADYLHVPLDQIQRGGVNQGDAQWAVRQLEAGMANNLYSLQQKASVAGLPAQDYAKLKMEMRDQSRGYDLMRQYADSVADSQQKGGRERTINEQPIIMNVNINGVTDPKAVADEVNRQIKKGMNEALMYYATGEKG